MSGIEALIVVIFGACFGSFITAASYRLPRDQDIVFKPSHCPKCSAELGARDLVPMLSWIFNKGKCRHCGARVHWRYPLIELVTSLLFLVIYARHGFMMETGLLGLLAVMLMILIVVDFEHYLIPDEVHYVLIPLGVIYRVLLGHELSDVAIGFAIGLGFALVMRLLYQKVRGIEGLGMGDVKLFAVAGVWIPPLTFVPFLCFSGLIGVLTALIWRGMGRGQRFPFGPAMAISLFICVVFPEVPETFWDWQYGLIR